MTETTFAGLRLLGAPGRVMVARPASEALVDAAAARIGDRRVRVADVGTGSGAIALALALRAPRAEIWATDISEDAVALTLANARRLGVEDRVRAVVGDLLEPIAPPLDLVVANLPYLPDRLADNPAYRKYAAEPADAIYAVGDGLDPYRRLAAQARTRLVPGGALVIQLHRRALEVEYDELATLPRQLPELARAA